MSRGGIDMKNCEEVRELLSFYLDNELHENDRKQIVKHLEDCDACKTELDLLKNVIEVIGETEEVEMPADFGQKLHERLEDAHNKSNFVKWTNKGNIFKWASTMVAGFVLLFAVVNSSYFNQLANNPKVAYVNDTRLDMVGKQAMGNEVQKQKAAEEKIQQKIAAPITQSKTIVKNNTKASVPTNSYISNSLEKKTINPVTQDNTKILYDTASTTNTDNKLNSVTPPQTSSMTLTVNDVSGAVIELNNIVKVNGGSVQTMQELGLMSTNSVTETNDLTLQIPVSSYSKVIDSIGAIGTIQMQPQVQSNSTQMTTAVPKAALSTTQINTVTVKISIQKK